MKADPLSIILLNHFFSSKSECFSKIAGSTFLCMRLNRLRGPTPQLMGMDDRQRDEKSDIHYTKNGYKSRYFPMGLYLPYKKR